MSHTRAVANIGWPDDCLFHFEQTTHSSNSVWDSSRKSRSVTLHYKAVDWRIVSWLSDCGDVGSSTNMCSPRGLAYAGVWCGPCPWVCMPPMMSSLSGQENSQFFSPRFPINNTIASRMILDTTPSKMSTRQLLTSLHASDFSPSLVYGPPILFPGLPNRMIRVVAWSPGGIPAEANVAHVLLWCYHCKYKTTGNAFIFYNMNNHFWHAISHDRLTSLHASNCFRESGPVILSWGLPIRSSPMPGLVLMMDLGFDC